MPKVILHIAERRDWDAAAVEGVYRPTSLQAEGFVHCSDPHQVVAVADAIFAGRSDLVLLAVDRSRLEADVRYEGSSPDGERFPHVYGPIPIASVIQVLELRPGPGGRFRFPLPELPEDWYASEVEWMEASRSMMERAYLASSDPLSGSGFHGGPERWRLGRHPIALAVDRDGAFLDIGCANGALMESLVKWTAERGFRIEPYGLEVSEQLAAVARSRLPGWADGILVGDAATWRPPRRFDFVRTELGYVPRSRRVPYVERLLAEVVEPGGRLIVCSYGSSSRRIAAEAIGDLLASWGLSVGGRAEAVEGNVAVTRVAWVEAPPRLLP